MWSHEHALETDATPDAVWRLWSDVAGWPRWDHALADAGIDGAFAAGTTGHITPHGQGPLAFTITEADPGRGFSDETRVPGAVIRFRHRVDAAGDGRRRIVHRVEIEGDAAGHIGPLIVQGLPGAMRALSDLAAAEG